MAKKSIKELESLLVKNIVTETEVRKNKRRKLVQLNE